MSAKNDQDITRLSRRQFLLFTGAGLAAGALGIRPLVSMAEAAPMPSVEAAEGDQTLVVAWPTSPNGLDHEFHNSVATLNIQRNVGLAPLKYGPLPNGKVFETDFSKLLPDAAKEWKLSPDSKSITITLNEGVLSSVGNELTADDFLYKFERSYALGGMKSGLLKMAMLLSDAKNIKKEGKYTFTINADAPNVLLEAMQTHEASVIFDSVEYKKHATDDDPWSTKWAANNFVGHGPYKITDYKPGQQWVLERNENYFRPSDLTGNISKIIYKEIPSSANRVALIESGDIDMAWDLGAAEIKKMETTPGVRVDNLAGTYLQWLAFAFGSTETPQLDDLNVRFAIQYALPYDQLLERPYLGLARQMRCTVAPIYPGWDVVSTIWNTQQDLAKAKEFMAQSPYPDGFKTTIHFDINAVGQEECAIIIKSALAEIGIDAEIVKQAAEQKAAAGEKAVPTKKAAVKK